MTSPIQKNLVEKNAEYASHFTKGDLALPPAKHYLILTCMDARLDPAAAFGIDLGDAHVIRNAGGSARDGQRSIIISEQLLGTKEIILIKHTGCGMLTFSNEDAHGLVKKNLGPSAVAEIATLNFLPFTNLEDAVREDVDYLRKSATVPDGVIISGWIYEVETGKVRQVV
ncbi:carbonate dehydratase [Annulohypoxylon maeteangense]|uniref:carbonate dehydratase n=1 Tax=Annulohypoxylon maeteangense TaxID=1927788 RepID=UPI002007A8E8|nr:carbonate dehydratase [Annulohypoxylon maeteangense]KAI0887717.1 carbonate dehydratase [Annulohypoxylon maeteangense]